MERLRSETPPIAYTVRASPLSPLPSLSWEYACEMRASVGPNGPHREAVRVQAFPYVMVVMEAALLCAHAGDSLGPAAVETWAGNGDLWMRVCGRG